MTISTRHLAVLAFSLTLLLPLHAADTPAPAYPDKLKLIEQSGSFAPMFPFRITHGLHDNLTNVQTWHPSPIPAGADGPVIPSQGVLTDATHTTDAPKRFLGTNICFSGCFPSHDEADKVADALARFGINAVRLHYAHHVMPKNGAYPKRDSFIEPVQLERFDYLYARLRQRGIAIYLQLNIGRRFGAHNGFQNADKLPWYNNGLDCFEPRMIQLHKDFCSEFLAHVNPYTKLAYKDDPAIANLEIANENSIVNAWFADKYKFHELTEPYASLLKRLWNDFLARKYPTLADLQRAWHPQNERALGDELMPEGILNANVKDAPDTPWGLQHDGVSQGDWQLLPATPDDQLQGRLFARLDIRKTGATPNMPQFFRTNFTFAKDRLYTLSFKLRSPKPNPVSIRFSQHHAPWRPVGIRTTIIPSPTWQTYTFPLRSDLDDPLVRLVFANFTPGTVDIADVSLREGAKISDDELAAFDSRQLPCPSPQSWSILKQRAHDFVAFLHELEDNYFSQLYQHLKTTVKPIQPITGTQLHYGLDHTQAKTDYCDNHAYWNHPAFPGKAWDGRNWHLGNKALVNASLPGSPLNSLARARILGKPYTVSEYDHPNTNLYAAEGNLMLAATAAFQNWAGIYQFAWSHSRDFERNVLSGMFDMCSMTAKLAHLPACHAMFVRGDVKTSAQQQLFAITPTIEQEIADIADRRSPHTLHDFPRAPLTRALPLALFSGVALPERPDLYSLQNRTVFRSFQELPHDLQQQFQNRRVQNETRQLTWDFSRPDKGLFLVDTPLTKAISGFPDGRIINLDGLSLQQGPSRLGWLTLSLVNTTPPQSVPTATPSLPDGDYLLAATGLIHNSGAVYADLGNDRISPAPANGGSIGHEPILCEGISATLTLHGLKPENIVCHALDTKGDKTTALPVADSPNGAVITLSPDYRTVWYQLSIHRR